ncbi:MAG: hypothetical protein L6R42_009174 [Xanthoria sp. 1 TBL-2021]|nr:MAG: hypothetical protein L6R42_009174 [Xanthoria sp. 1 TBL-2021]
MNAAGSPSLKRNAEHPQDAGTAIAKKSKIEDDSSSCKTPIVVLVVGPELVPFDADKNLICGSSRFFEAAFNGRFKESSGLIELEEDDVDVFEHFMQWLHSREIDIAQVSDRKRRFTQLSRLYVFADKYGIVRLKNHVMTMLFDTIKHPERTYRTGEPGSHCIRIETMDYVYYNTVRGSLLRKFIAAI